MCFSKNERPRLTIVPKLQTLCSQHIVLDVFEDYNYFALKSCQEPCEDHSSLPMAGKSIL